MRRREGDGGAEYRAHAAMKLSLTLIPVLPIEGQLSIRVAEEHPGSEDSLSLRLQSIFHPQQMLSRFHSGLQPIIDVFDEYV